MQRYEMGKRLMPSANDCYGPASDNTYANGPATNRDVAGLTAASCNDRRATQELLVSRQRSEDQLDRACHDELGNLPRRPGGIAGMHHHCCLAAAKE